MPDQPPATQPDPRQLPGRIVDIVHEAARRAGVDIYSYDLTFRPRLTLVVYTGRDTRGLVGALAVCARLGVTDPSVSVRPDSDFGRVRAHVDALDVDMEIFIDRPADAPEAGDVAALVADVDTARAAAADDWTPEEVRYAPHGHPAHDGDPGNCGGCHAEAGAA